MVLPPKGQKRDCGLMQNLLMSVKGKGKVIKLHIHSKADSTVAFPKLLSFELCNFLDSLCSIESVNKLPQFILSLLKHLR